MPVNREHCQCRGTQFHFFERAFRSLQLRAAQQELLVASFRETAINIPLQTHSSNGDELQTFIDYRVQLNHARAPFKRGF